MPGMSAQVDLSLSAPRRDAPLVIPADALVIRANGSEVAIVRPNGTRPTSKRFRWAETTETASKSSTA